MRVVVGRRDGQAGVDRFEATEPDVGTGKIYQLWMIPAGDAKVVARRVIETRVFDHTAIIALFQGSTPAFRVWEAAEDDRLTLILPAVAVAEANGVIGADSNAWRAILDPGRVVVTPLNESTAIEVDETPGIHGATHTQGGIVTAAPWKYPPGAPPLWTL